MCWCHSRSVCRCVPPRRPCPVLGPCCRTWQTGEMAWSARLDRRPLAPALEGWEGSWMGPSASERGGTTERVWCGKLQVNARRKRITVQGGWTLEQLVRGPGTFLFGDFWVFTVWRPQQPFNQQSPVSVNRAVYCFFWKKPPGLLHCKS